MKKVIQQRINDYAEYFGRNIPYFQKDGSVLTELNFDFEKMSDDLLNLYEDALQRGNQDDDILQGTSNSEGDMSKALEKVKLQDDDLKDLLLKLNNCTVFEGSIIIVNQRISDEVLYMPCHAHHTIDCRDDRKHSQCQQG